MTTSDHDRPAIRGVAITTATAFDVCAALLASADVTVDVVWADGSTTTSLPLQKGYNPIQVQKVTFASGTIVALYN
jgi:hypothetical protein